MLLIKNSKDKLVQLKEENARLAKALQEYQLQRAQANVQLLQLLEFNERVLGNLALGLVALDAQGRINLINKSAAEMLELDAKACKGQSLSKVLVEKVPQENGLLRSISSNLSTLRGETTLRLGGGKERLISFNISTSRAPNGSFDGAILLLADLTRLREQEKRLQRQEQLASVGRLSADIAHQIKNPLAGMQSLLQVSLHKIKENPQVHQNLELILEEVRKLDHLVSDTLRFARPAAINAQELQLNEIVIETLALVTLRDKAHSRLKLTRRFSFPSARVLADRDQLREVILNLVHNALEAMSEGGTLTISTGIQKEDAEGKRWAFLKVADSGIGIPASLADKIFDPFFTTKPTGSGLGLPTCRRIVDSLGGKIEFQSRPRKGTTFTVWLPQVD